MKKISFLGIFILAFQTITAQEVFQKNTFFVDTQGGIASTGGMLGVGVHWGFTPVLSIGANLSYNTIDPKEEWFTAYIPELSIDYHFGKLQRTDWYVGVSGGYCFWESDKPYSRNDSGCSVSKLDDKFRRDFIYNGHIGFRSFVYRNIGIAGQLGFGNAHSLRLGVCIKL